MVDMKNINDINPFDYESFYFLGDVENPSLKALTSSGYIDVDNYEIINTDSGSLIGFTRPIAGHHNYICNESINVNLVYYDQLFDILDKKEKEGFNFFLFVDSVQVPAYEEYIKTFNKSKTKEGTTPIRCDYDQYGGFPFHIPEKGYTILKTMNVLNIAGVGHVAYFETAETENQNPNHHSINAGTETYAGMLRNIYEWAVVANPPFNNTEKIAQKANEMWQKLDLPDSIRNWIENEYPNMRVAQYINGNKEIVQYVENENLMPESLSNYIKEKCKYRTLTSLKNSHPANVSIPQSLLDAEKNTLDTLLYDFSLRNDFDYSNKDYLDYLDFYMKNKRILNHSSEYDCQKLMEKITCIQKTL